ncbi:antiviral helicase [Pelomyxa schiedti]|nr:antiviral helicase [Pelomyxa schiedti]
MKGAKKPTKGATAPTPGSLSNASQLQAQATSTPNPQTVAPPSRQKQTQQQQEQPTPNKNVTPTCAQSVAIVGGPQQNQPKPKAKPKPVPQSLPTDAASQDPSSPNHGDHNQPQQQNQRRKKPVGGERAAAIPQLSSVPSSSSASSSSPGVGISAGCRPNGGAPRAKPSLDNGKSSLYDSALATLMEMSAGVQLGPLRLTQLQTSNVDSEPSATEVIANKSSKKNNKNKKAIPTPAPPQQPASVPKLEEANTSESLTLVFCHSWPAHCDKLEENLNHLYSHLRFPTSRKEAEGTNATPLDCKSVLSTERLVPWVINNEVASLTVTPPQTTIDLSISDTNYEILADQEVRVEQLEGTSRTSMSLKRKWESTSGDFYSGSTQNFPFQPGGLEIKAPIKTVVDLTYTPDWESIFNGKGVLLVPPGFARGLGSIAKPSAPAPPSLQEGSVTSSIQVQGEIVPVESDQETLLQQITQLRLKPEWKVVRGAGDITTAASKVKSQWAIADTTDVTNFRDIVPDMVIEYPFELDEFQKRSVIHLEAGESVFVAAHTSAGKTLVAEYAIALCFKHMTRAIYTSPIKALSNQKFRDFKETFEDVGLITGDVALHPEASCLIVTTEILRSMLYRGADLIRDIEWVIFDEVHYVNDAERGVVWEEVIIMLPSHVNLILLSATVPNALEFAEWIGRTKKKNIYVISTAKRPVPLEHFIYSPSLVTVPSGARSTIPPPSTPQNASSPVIVVPLPKIVDASRQFLVNNYRTISETCKGKNPDKNMSGKVSWMKLVGMLKQYSLIPCVIFTFSKKKCEEFAHSISTIDFTSGSDKSEIHTFIEQSLSKLKEIDRTLPQILRMKQLLKRGIGVHHGGLLPIVKEIVEILFGKGLVRVLFATETFAMGVNMPARTVVFSNIRKHDGKEFRYLLSGEYTQMSGRAGRRGKDAFGTVILNCTDVLPDSFTLKQVILGTGTKLSSQFRLTYNMILNLLRIEGLSVEDMMKRSFAETTSQQHLPTQLALLKEAKSLLSRVTTLMCKNNLCDIPQMNEVAQTFWFMEKQYRREVVNRLLDSAVIQPGRILLLDHPNHYPTPTYAVVAQVDKTTNPPKIGVVTVNNSHSLVPVKASQIASVFKNSITIDQSLSYFSVAPSMVEQTSVQLNQFAKKKGSTLTPLHPLEDIKNLPLELYDLLEQHKDAKKNFDTLVKLPCPLVKQHLQEADTITRLQRHVQKVTEAMSDTSLSLMPDFNGRLAVLQQLQYVDHDLTVLMKGRVAREINTCDSLIVTELIFSNFFSELHPAEMVAVLSVLVFQERDSSDNDSFSPRLQQLADDLTKLVSKLADIQTRCGMDLTEKDYMKEVLHFGVYEVVYEWARQLPFYEICRATTVQEGSIVRCIVRLDETCNELKSAARIIGDTTLFTMCTQASLLIKRDIVFATSLYLE